MPRPEHVDESLIRDTTYVELRELRIEGGTSERFARFRRNRAGSALKNRPTRERLTNLTNSAEVAQVEGATLVTHDRAFDVYDLPVLWA